MVLGGEILVRKLLFGTMVFLISTSLSGCATGTEKDLSELKETYCDGKLVASTDFPINLVQYGPTDLDDKNIITFRISDVCNENIIISEQKDSITITYNKNTPDDVSDDTNQTINFASNAVWFELEYEIEETSTFKEYISKFELYSAIYEDPNEALKNVSEIIENTDYSELLMQSMVILDDDIYFMLMMDSPNRLVSQSISEVAGEMFYIRNKYYQVKISEQGAYSEISSNDQLCMCNETLCGRLGNKLCDSDNTYLAVEYNPSIFISTFSSEYSKYILNRKNYRFSDFQYPGVLITNADGKNYVKIRLPEYSCEWYDSF